MTNSEKDYEVCFRAENVQLPKNGYFGLSAATGGLADDHDVIHFLTTSFHSSDSASTQNQSKSVVTLKLKTLFTIRFFFAM